MRIKNGQKPFSSTTHDYLLEEFLGPREAGMPSSRLILPHFPLTHTLCKPHMLSLSHYPHTFNLLSVCRTLPSLPSPAHLSTSPLPSTSNPKLVIIAMFHIMISVSSSHQAGHLNGGVTTTGPDAAHPPTIFQNLGGGGQLGGGGGSSRGRGGGGGCSCQGSGGGCSCQGSGGGVPSRGRGGVRGASSQGRGGGVRVRVRVTELVEPVLVL